MIAQSTAGVTVDAAAAVNPVHALRAAERHPFAALTPGRGAGRGRGARAGSRRAPVCAQQLRKPGLSRGPRRRRAGGAEVLPCRALVGSADTRGACLRARNWRPRRFRWRRRCCWRGSTLHRHRRVSSGRVSVVRRHRAGARSARRARTARPHTGAHPRGRGAPPISDAADAGARTARRARTRQHAALSAAARAHARTLRRGQRRAGAEASRPRSRRPRRSSSSACMATAISAISCGSSAARCWSIWTIA